MQFRMDEKIWDKIKEFQAFKLQQLFSKFFETKRNDSAVISSKISKYYQMYNINNNLIIPKSKKKETIQNIFVLEVKISTEFSPILQNQKYLLEYPQQPLIIYENFES